MSGFAFKVELGWKADQFRVYGVRFSHDDIQMQPLGLMTVGPLLAADASAEHIDPMLELTRRDAQKLFDELWSAGLRPKQDQSDGERSAMKAHIADLRQVMMALLPDKGMG